MHVLKTTMLNSVVFISILMQIKFLIYRLKLPRGTLQFP